MCYSSLSEHLLQETFESKKTHIEDTLLEHLFKIFGLVCIELLISVSRFFFFFKIYKFLYKITLKIRTKNIRNTINNY